MLIGKEFSSGGEKFKVVAFDIEQNLALIEEADGLISVLVDAKFQENSLSASKKICYFINRQSFLKIVSELKTEDIKKIGSEIRKRYIKIPTKVALLIAQAILENTTVD